MVTLAGVHPPPPGIDSLLGDDEEDSRGPEWCVDLGDEIRAMNKFELWLALGTGDYAPSTLVWRIGRERWQPAQDIPELACALKVHHQTLMMAAKAAEQAEHRTPSASMVDKSTADRRSRASLPRILTPENSVLVAQLAASAEADTPLPIGDDVELAAPANDVAATSVRPSTRSTAPASRRAKTAVKRPIARFATALAAVAGTLLFLLSRGDMRQHVAGAIVPVDAAPEAQPEPVVAVVEPEAPATPTSQPLAAAPSVSPHDMDDPEPKPSKKTRDTARKRVKDGLNGVAAGIEADRRGRARQKRAH